MMTLKAYRKSRELTQIEMARVLGTNQGTVSRWEAGTIPSPEMIKLIAQKTDGKVAPAVWYETEAAA